jgi:hypothetical protein
MRRALLLFAIVLGMAALAASLSRPPDQGSGGDSGEARDSGPPTARPGPASEEPAAAPPQPAVELVAAEDDTARLETGRAATVEVAVDEPGTVEIPELGLTTQADDLTPARFDVFPTRSDTYEIVFTPVDGDNARPAGRLDVRSEG